MASSARSDMDVSIIAPAHNEAENLRALIDEVEHALNEASVSWEFILADDGSTDATPSILAEQARSRSFLRPIRMLHTPPGRGNGQSAAFYAAIRASQGRLIVMLDADRQNDPADIPPMLDMLQASGADFVQGDRSANRRDTLGRRVASWVGRTFRRLLLGDVVRDTGCSLRVMKREIALQLPLQYRGMHRFIPITAKQLGYAVVEMPVNHRPRVAGKAKYGLFDRAIPGLIDCFAVRWMRNRRRSIDASAIADDAGSAVAKPKDQRESPVIETIPQPSPAQTRATSQR